MAVNNTVHENKCFLKNFVYTSIKHITTCYNYMYTMIDRGLIRTTISKDALHTRIKLIYNYIYLNNDWQRTFPDLL